MFTGDPVFASTQQSAEHLTEENAELSVDVSMLRAENRNLLNELQKANQAKEVAQETVATLEEENARISQELRHRMALLEVKSTELIRVTNELLSARQQLEFREIDRTVELADMMESLRIQGRSDLKESLGEDVKRTHFGSLELPLPHRSEMPREDTTTEDSECSRSVTADEDDESVNSFPGAEMDEIWSRTASRAPDDCSDQFSDAAAVDQDVFRSPPTFGKADVPEVLSRERWLMQELSLVRAMLRASQQKERAARASLKAKSVLMRKVVKQDSKDEEARDNAELRNRLNLFVKLAYEFRHFLARVRLESEDKCPLERDSPIADVMDRLHCLLSTPDEAVVLSPPFSE